MGCRSLISVSLLMTYVIPIRSGNAFNRTNVLNNLLNSTYDSRISPDYERDVPTEVFVQIYVHSIDSINEATMDYSINIFLRQKWVDLRLKFKGTIEPLELDAKRMSQVWVPDLFFPNEKQASFHEVTVPNKLMHLYHNGTVLYSTRISMVLTCYMRLEKFPLDDQECSMVIESYGYTTGNIVLRWHNTMPVFTNSLMELPQFSMKELIIPQKCTKNYGETGDFACLKVIFKLKRNLGYYMVQLYVPSILIVALSWVSFWLNMDAIPERISLGVLTVLTMMTQSSSTGSALPPVSYIKAIDIWNAFCMFFVFGALLECAVINVLTRTEIRRNTMKLRSRNFNGAANSRLIGRNPENLYSIPFGKQRAKSVDKVARFAFPISFLLFNFCYWMIYNIWKIY